MKKFCSYSFVLIFSIIPVFLHPQISVSYQSFQPDDIVVDVDQWKMTAKQLGEYGVEPLKVVMVNDGNTDETCMPDKQYLLPYDVYKRLKYYAGPSWIKGYGIPLVSYFIVMLPLFAIMFPQELKEIEQEGAQLSGNFSAHTLIQSVQACGEMAVRMVSTAMIKSLFFVSSSLGIPLLIRRCFIQSVAVSNEALFSYIHQEMFFESCQIPAHTTITKLMFVPKQQDKK